MCLEYSSRPHPATQGGAGEMLTGWASQYNWVASACCGPRVGISSPIFFWLEQSWNVLELFERIGLDIQLDIWLCFNIIKKSFDMIYLFQFAINLS